MIDVSIVIPVYNASALLDRCLDSVFNQKGGYTVEVILIDDGSKDNSIELIERRPEQDRILLLRQENSGPAKARNRGIKIAQGRYLAFLDADDYWMPEFLERTVSFLDTHKDCVAVSVAQKHITVSGESTSPNGWAELAPADGMVIGDFYEFWAEHNHICTGSILIRREIAQQAGGMREEMRVCEDLEYWAMIASYGKMGYIPAILFVSDGNQVSQNIGWAKKMRPRWENTPMLDDWLKRLRERGVANSKESEVRLLKNKSLPMVYNKMMTGKWRMARKEAKRYKESFPRNSVGRMFGVASGSILLWSMLMAYVRWHENTRKI